MVQMALCDLLHTYHKQVTNSSPGEATSPNPYLYVRLDFGGKWVIFQSRLEQEGYPHMSRFWGSFSNMDTMFMVQMKHLHLCHKCCINRINCVITKCELDVLL